MLINKCLLSFALYNQVWLDCAVPHMILFAFCSASGPQNGWNDPPTFHRVPKKKKVSFIKRNSKK